MQQTNMINAGSHPQFTPQGWRSDEQMSTSPWWLMQRDATETQDGVYKASASEGGQTVSSFATLRQGPYFSGHRNISPVGENSSPAPAEYASGATWQPQGSSTWTVPDPIDPAWEKAAQDDSRVAISQSRAYPQNMMGGNFDFSGRLKGVGSLPEGADGAKVLEYDNGTHQLDHMTRPLQEEAGTSWQVPVGVGEGHGNGGGRETIDFWHQQLIQNPPVSGDGLQEVEAAQSPSPMGQIAEHNWSEHQGSPHGQLSPLSALAPYQSNSLHVADGATFLGALRDSSCDKNMSGQVPEPQWLTPDLSDLDKGGFAAGRTIMDIMQGEKQHQGCLSSELQQHWWKQNTGLAGKYEYDHNACHHLPKQQNQWQQQEEEVGEDMRLQMQLNQDYQQQAQQERQPGGTGLLRLEGLATPQHNKGLGFSLPWTVASEAEDFQPNYQQQELENVEDVLEPAAEPAMMPEPDPSSNRFSSWGHIGKEDSMLQEVSTGQPNSVPGFMQLPAGCQVAAPEIVDLLDSDSDDGKEGEGIVEVENHEPHSSLRQLPDWAAAAEQRRRRFALPAFRQPRRIPSDSWGRGTDEDNPGDMSNGKFDLEKHTSSDPFLGLTLPTYPSPGESNERREGLDSSMPTTNPANRATWPAGFIPFPKHHPMANSSTQLAIQKQKVGGDAFLPSSSVPVSATNQGRLGFMLASKVPLGGLGQPLQFSNGGRLNPQESEAYQSVMEGLALSAGAEETVDESLMTISLLKHQRQALAWMLKREESTPAGGILADDQGLGKTISTIALILRGPRHTVKVRLGGDSEQPLPASPSATVDLVDDDDDPMAVQQQGAAKAEWNLQTSELVPAKRTFLGQMKLPLSPEPLADADRWQASLQTPASICKSEKFEAIEKKVKVEQEETKALTARPPAGTLVVCPTSVLRQWAQELRDKVTPAGKLSVLVYHGAARTRSLAELARYDVVLTSYAIVTMEVPKQPLPDEEKDSNRRPADYGLLDAYAGGWPKPSEGQGADSVGSKSKRRGKVKGVGDGGKKKSKHFGEGDSADALPPGSGPLARVAWLRVVLDEAQSIKNCRTQVARACWGLRAKRRWCLSGTPIQNHVDDLYSYFRFLRYQPHDEFKNFRRLIKDVIARDQSYGYRRLRLILQAVMLRRTKGSKIDGQLIVNLPERRVNLVKAEFSVEERAFYDSLETASRLEFQSYAAAGTVQSNYVNILYMLLRLRQACDHPLLVKQGNTQQAAEEAARAATCQLAPEQREQLLSVLESHTSMCGLCQDAPEDAVISSCFHVFCHQCIAQHLALSELGSCPCPACKATIGTQDIHVAASLRNPAQDVPSGDPVAHWQAQGGGWAFPAATKGSSLVAKAGSRRGLADADVAPSSKIQEVMQRLRALPKVFALVADGRVLKLVDDDPRKVAASKASSDLACQWGPAGAESPASQNTTAELDGNGGDDGAAACQVAAPLGEGVGVVPTTEKAIVFSQWTSMLDLVEGPLRREGLGFRRLDGTMSIAARERAVSDFNCRPEVTVMLMSLKAASLGLNMVAACHVLLLDLWWNPATEEQAIDRAHRIGQTRPVHVWRFTICRSIEDRILALQEKKRTIVANVFGEGGGKTGTGASLSVDDLHFLFSK